MSRIAFSKVALSLDEQAALLISRGLETDVESLVATLTKISYYRLSGYAWNFQREESELFETGTTLADVLDLYQFDSRLRQLMFGLATVIELELRTRFVNSVGQAYGPMGYSEPKHANSPAALARDLEELRQSLERNTDGHVQSFYDHHNDSWPPVWLSTELMSFGLLSRWFDNLQSEALRKEIALGFGLAPPILTSYLRQLTLVRNYSAHHMRLWNKHFPTGIAQVRRTPPELAEAVAGSDEHRIYRCLVMSAYVAKVLNPSTGFVVNLREHLLAHERYLATMDVPTRFEESPLWQ